MFQLLKEDEFSFPSFLVQQTLVPIAGFLGLLFTSDAPSAFPKPTLGNVWISLIALFLPFCVGLVARRAAPRLSRDGRLIWVAPMSLLMLCVVSDSVRFGFKRTVAQYFNPGTTGEEGLMLVLVVIPTCACLAYSLESPRRSPDWLPFCEFISTSTPQT